MLTERSFLLASCFGKHSILLLLSTLLYPLKNSGQFLLLISAAVNVADEEDVEGEDVEDEEGVLPNCVNLLVSSCLEYGNCAKISLLSFKVNLFKRIQTMWIYTCFVLRGFEK